MPEINPGDRVQTHKWAPEVYAGTVTRVDTDADLRERAADGDDDPTRYVYVKWDGAAFTEDQLDPSEVEIIEGWAEPTAPYAVIG